MLEELKEKVFHANLELVNTLQSIPENRRSGTHPLYLCDSLGTSRL